jgi:hypothetical protein
MKVKTIGAKFPLPKSKYQSRVITVLSSINNQLCSAVVKINGELRHEKKVLKIFEDFLQHEQKCEK